MSDAHRHHETAAVLDAHRRVLAAADSDDPDAIVAALARLNDLRAKLDQAELRLLTGARRHRVSWTRIASALGLRSRQAAEQRAARLAEQVGSGVPEVECQHCVDTIPMEALRRAVRETYAQLIADPSWDGAYPRATLAREHLHAAAQAPPGSLYSLVKHVIGDLSGVELIGRPVLVRVAVARLREAFEDAAPAPRHPRPH
ncbi:hypothetical protein [Catellatospora tritici]|uniref:hypothetical protein n=1 Tax=Catellatospora tritici TaxID=2851566 RepID=UPI001C2DE678|nr:hypothetical protein [Catellatospora tritici]MBV1852705.1 hypothetical protein [Catellatospora tritici]